MPFNFKCAAPVLPTPDLPPSQFGFVPIDYINLQYNYRTVTKSQWFNPYAQFIHDKPEHGGLGATPYAFSIDDSLSVQNNAGAGLILVVGGPEGLPNRTQVPPPVPLPFPYYTFELDLQPPAGPVKWAKYGVCSADATTDFPSSGSLAYAIGVTPKAQTFLHDNPDRYESEKISDYDPTGCFAEADLETLAQWHWDRF